MIKLNEFITSINNRGILKTNKFIATMNFPTNHYLNSRSGSSRLLSARCDSVQLPGVSIASADGPPRLGYGPIEKNPYNVNFEDINLTFIVDANSEVHKTLYEWVNCIVSFHNTGGGKQLTQESTLNNAAAYEVGYRNKYAIDLVVNMYRGDTGSETDTTTYKPSMVFTAFNAFPMGFPSNALNWNEGDVLRITIPFAYTDYSVKYNAFK